MVSGALSTVTALASLIAAVPGQTGSILGLGAPLDAPEGRTTGDRARGILDGFASCIVRYHHAQAVKALAAPADLAIDGRTLPGLMDGECISGKNSAVRSYGGLDIGLTTNPITFRGALFKALVRKDYGRQPVSPAATAPALGGYNGGMLAFADCVVRRDPAASLKLIEATAGSEAEQRALDDLKPQLGPCLTGGAQIRFSKGSLIGFLSEAYYREAAASTAPTSIH